MKRGVGRFIFLAVTRTKCAPQFGGFCAYGVVLGKLFPVDINTWQVRDARLHLNLNTDILKKFNEDLGGNVAKAEKNWPGLVKKNGKYRAAPAHVGARA